MYEKRFFSYLNFARNFFYKLKFVFENLLSKIDLLFLFFPFFFIIRTLTLLLICLFVFFPALSIFFTSFFYFL